ncbi:hypothetical protein [Marivirga sp.]|uniref:hypothetical protein n=1 Tax=Marivirga sp. TaxID=2018662 RepID=UPI0025F526ED|nr:hypothetical protein [Marivirga sp.]
MKKIKGILAIITVLVATSFFYFSGENRAVARQSEESCTFDYDAGCADKGSTSCTSCDPDGPVVEGEKPKEIAG